MKWVIVHDFKDGYYWTGTGESEDPRRAEVFTDRDAAASLLKEVRRRCACDFYPDKCNGIKLRRRVPKRRWVVKYLSDPPQYAGEDRATEAGCYWSNSVSEGHRFTKWDAGVFIRQRVEHFRGNAFDYTIEAV